MSVTVFLCVWSSIYQKGWVKSAGIREYIVVYCQRSRSLGGEADELRAEVDETVAVNDLFGLVKESVPLRVRIICGAVIPSILPYGSRLPRPKTRGTCGGLWGRWRPQASWCILALRSVQLWWGWRTQSSWSKQGGRLQLLSRWWVFLIWRRRLGWNW